MPRPKDVKAIDLLMGIPVSHTNEEWYEQFKPLLMDRESRDNYKMPAQYMFKGIPRIEDMSDPVGYVVSEMDKHGIERAVTGYYEGVEATEQARIRFPDRFLWDWPANPNKGMDEIRLIKRLRGEGKIDSVSLFPCGLNPQVPINDKKMYPLYAACVELDMPIFCTVGVPGPRVPMAPQLVELVDEVCWFFPELKFVMRHGGEPWEALAVKLMVKYPNLYYSTSAFAPKHYPKAVIQYANTRGAEKVMYAGYFPSGLTLDRIFKELDDVPFKDEVWPKFLRDNALKLFKLDR